jgi:dipeptidyl aminopeptidase/acylaminoacyl peptidase
VLAFEAERLLVAAGETGVTLLDPESGGVTSLPHDGGVLTAAFAPGGRVVTVSTSRFGSDGERGDDDLRVWDLANRTILSRIARNERGIFALSPDGRRFADATGRAQVEVRDVATGATTHEIAAEGLVGELVFSPDGARLAVVAGDRMMVRVWDLATSTPGPERRVGGAWVAAVDPAGRYLAVSSHASSATWLLDLELGRKLEVDGIEQATNHAVLDAAGRFAALTTDLGPVEVRALPSAEVLLRLPHTAFGAAFSPDGAHEERLNGRVPGAHRVVQRPEQPFRPEEVGVKPPHHQGGKKPGQRKPRILPLDREPEERARQRHGPALDQERVRPEPRDHTLDHLQVLDAVVLEA